MISDSLSNAELYSNISSLFKESFDFLKTLDPEVECGSIEIKKDLVAHIGEYETSEVFKHGWETHKKYIDIQYCLKGKERIQWSPLDNRLTETSNYNPDKDVTFYNGDGDQTFINVGNGTFAIFFPRDAHAPQLMIDTPQMVKKVVIKVPVESLNK